MNSVKEFIKSGITQDCQRFKKRSPGSQSEYDCQKHFEKLLRQWSDSVQTEEFTLHPHAFLGWIILCAAIEIIAIILLWFGVFKNAALLWLSLILTVLAALIAWFEFFRYRQFIDFLFPQRVSHNVFAVRKSIRPAKKRIILGGHADAAYEFTYIHKFKARLGIPIVVTGVAGVVTTLSAAVVTIIAAAFHASIWKRIQIAAAAIATLFIPVFIALFFFTNWNCVTDGANDNLSACYAAFSVMKHLSEHDIRFDETEVCCLITGSEEAGLRGADAFVKKHADMLTDVETIFIAMDTLREVDQLQVYTSGMYGTQKSSDAVGSLVSKAAAEYGFLLKTAEPYPGACDADAFARAGFLACGLCAVDHDPKPYYHTREDNSDNIDPDCIELCARICLRAAELYDQHGL